MLVCRDEALSLSIFDLDLSWVLELNATLLRERVDWSKLNGVVVVFDLVSVFGVNVFTPGGVGVLEQANVSNCGWYYVGQGSHTCVVWIGDLGNQEVLVGEDSHSHEATTWFNATSVLDVVHGKFELVAIRTICHFHQFNLDVVS